MGVRRRRGIERRKEGVAIGMDAEDAGRTRDVAVSGRRTHGGGRFTGERKK
jgi:hypothetical protein